MAKRVKIVWANGTKEVLRCSEVERTADTTILTINSEEEEKLYLNNKYIKSFHVIKTCQLSTGLEE